MLQLMSSALKEWESNKVLQHDACRSNRAEVVPTIRHLLEVLVHRYFLILTLFYDSNMAWHDFQLLVSPGRKSTDADNISRDSCFHVMKTFIVNFCDMRGHSVSSGLVSRCFPGTTGNCIYTYLGATRYHQVKYPVPFFVLWAFTQCLFCLNSPWNSILSCE